MKRFLLVALLFALAPLSHAGEAEYIGGDPETQKKVMEISGELRCLVCQGQSLADSNSKFAIDMRDYIRELMEGGKSKDEVIEFMVQRYGDYVRYRPPLNVSTILLWFGPFLLLAIGVVVLRMNVVQRKKQILLDVPLSDEEHRRAVELLKSRDADVSGDRKE